MEEISSQADIAEMQTLRQPQQSFGVQILDAAALAQDGHPAGVLPVRRAGLPSTASSARASRPAGVAFTWPSGGASTSWLGFVWATMRRPCRPSGLINDYAVLMLCLGCYFGHRNHRKAVFGGSTNTSKAGGRVGLALRLSATLGGGRRRNELFLRRRPPSSICGWPRRRAEVQRHRMRLIESFEGRHKRSADGLIYRDYDHSATHAGRRASAEPGKAG